MSDTDCTWQTHTFCDWQRLSETDRHCLSQTQIVCERHRLFVKETDCLWQTQTVHGRGLLLITEAHHFYHWYLNIIKCVSIYKLGIYYLHTPYKPFRLNPLRFSRKLKWNWFTEFHGQFRIIFFDPGQNLNSGVLGQRR